MPIQFRCPHCTRLLGVARRKAGAQVRCPRCGRPTTVPGGDDGGPFDDLDEALTPAGRSAAGGVATAPAPIVASPSARDQPLFEAEDLDAILGVKPAASAAFELDDAPAGPRPVSGPDAASLPDHDGLVLSVRAAVVLGAVVLALLVGAFVVGVSVGARW